MLRTGLSNHERPHTHYLVIGSVNDHYRLNGHLLSDPQHLSLLRTQISALSPSPN
jgi:hypothetical protein